MLLMKSPAVEALSSRLQEPAWLKKKREGALEAFQQLPLPNFRYGITARMDYSDLPQELLDPPDSIADVPQPSAAFQAPPGVVEEHPGVFIGPLQEFAKRQPALAEASFMRLFNPAASKIAAFHAAFWASSVVIFVPKGVAIHNPLALRTTQQSPQAATHTLIIAEEGSSVMITEHLQSAGRQPALASTVTEVFVARGAQVRFVRVQDYARSAFHFDEKIAHVAGGGRMEWSDIFLGGAFTHSETGSILAGDGSSCSAGSLFFGDGEQRFDLAASAVHGGKHTSSRLTGRGVLNGRAKNISRSLIRIGKGAVGSNGFEKQDTLSLSPFAEADNIPKLEIDNNDVKCGHAATVGQVDRDKLFYLMARGLSEEAARKLLVSGFFEPLLAALPSPLADAVRAQLEARLPC